MYYIYNTIYWQEISASSTELLAITRLHPKKGLVLRNLSLLMSFCENQIKSSHKQFTG